MSIIRVKKDANYFAASNEAFNDDRLSWEARGLMGYLLSKPDDWKIRMSDLEKKGPAGNFKLRRVLAELRKYGYMNRVRVTNENKTFDWITEVYESPSQNPRPSREIVIATGGFPTCGSPTSGASTSGKLPDVLSTDLPSTDAPSTEQKKEEEGGKTESVRTIYEHEIGILTPAIFKALEEAERVHGPQWVCEALKIASKNGQRRWSYANAILERWKVEGYGTEKGQGAPVQRPARKRNRYTHSLLSEFTGGE